MSKPDAVISVSIAFIFPDFSAKPTSYSIFGWRIANNRVRSPRIFDDRIYNPRRVTDPPNALLSERRRVFMVRGLYYARNGNGM